MDGNRNDLTNTNELFSFFANFGNGVYNFVNSINKIGESIASFMIEAKPAIEGLLVASEWANAAKTCEENQWVLFEIPLDIIREIYNNPTHCDNILYEYYTANSNENLKKLFERYRGHSQLQHNSAALSETFDCFLNGKYHRMIALSLIAILDGVLARIANNGNTQWLDRLKCFDNATDGMTIEEIFDLYPGLESRQLLMLMWTFDAIVNFAAPTIDNKGKYDREFKGKEPPIMNRHWIMHGRSTRELTNVDCIKLFVFLFAMLKLDDFRKVIEATL